MSKEEFFRDLSFVIASYMVEIYPTESDKWRLQRATYIVAKIFDEVKV